MKKQSIPHQPLLSIALHLALFIGIGVIPLSAQTRSLLLHAETSGSPSLAISTAHTAQPTIALKSFKASLSYPTGSPISSSAPETWLPDKASASLLRKSKPCGQLSTNKFSHLSAAPIFLSRSPLATMMPLATKMKTVSSSIY